MSVLSCAACETTWLGSYSARCWSCGAEGVARPLKVPSPSGMGIAATHYERMPDAEDADFWSPW